MMSAIKLRRQTDLLDWLTNQVVAGEGAYTFGLTEDGLVGLFRAEEKMAIGVGDNAADAIQHAKRKQEPRKP